MGIGKRTSRLKPLLQPDSIAVVGASERPGSVGLETMSNLLTGRFEGRLYAVNPGYGSIRGVPCFPRWSARWPMSGGGPVCAAKWKRA